METASIAPCINSFAACTAVNAVAVATTSSMSDYLPSLTIVTIAARVNYEQHAKRNTKACEKIIHFLPP